MTPENLASHFAQFRADPLHRFAVKIRRTRAAQIRELLSQSEAMDFQTFNYEVWNMESATFWNGEKISLENLVFKRKASTLELEELERAFEDGEIELHGNYIWGTGTKQFGAMLSNSESEKTSNIKGALHLLNERGYAQGLLPRDKVKFLVDIPGLGISNATGLAMIFHPTEIALKNKEPEAAFQILGLAFKTPEEFQSSAQKLKEQLGAEDFLELDWFLYNFNRMEHDNNEIGSTPVTPERIFKIAPGQNAMYWRECRDGNYICIGWDELGDLSSYQTKEEFIEATREEFEKLYSLAAKRSAKVNEVWKFRTLKPGDVIVANQGASKVLGVGDVIGPGYQWRPERPHMKHTVAVKWRPMNSVTIPSQGGWPLVTLGTVSPALYLHIIGEAPPPTKPDPIVEVIDPDSDEVEVLPPYIEPSYTEIAQTISEAGMRVDEQTLRRYHLSLKTRGFVILSGISGGGKTWLARLYAGAIDAKCEVVPVAPNWTANEDLLGFWNPMDGAYHDTLFSRFLREAAQEFATMGSGARPYHLVLDEMNLARVEYYFAKFLSLLEVRAQDGDAEIELGPNEQITLPPNLVFVGTVNMDETTHGFADKVYDRAQLLEIEVSRAQLEKHLEGWEHAGVLLQVWDAVHISAPFAFRVLDEIQSYLDAAALHGIAWETAFDEQLLQKILPKFKGTDLRVGDALTAFAQITNGSFPLSHQKASAMLDRFHQSGFVSFF